MSPTHVNPAACAAFVVLAFSLAGLGQSVWLGSALSRRFAYPLDGGRTWRGRRVFGDNKTARGFVFMVPAVAVSFATLRAFAALTGTADGLWRLSPAEYLAAGFLAGLGFMAGELPNSFVKRQLGIPPGARPAGRFAAVCSFLADRLDSVVGMLAVLSLAVQVPPLVWAYLLVVGPVIHGAFSVLVYRLGGKARAA
jgi:CDP-2,3-bis-(O-geranylgeranyl)-sn-glycerol synthase